jgi:hypothetical protein
LTSAMQIEARLIVAPLPTVDGVFAQLRQYWS